MHYFKYIYIYILSLELKHFIIKNNVHWYFFPQNYTLLTLEERIICYHNETAILTLMGKNIINKNILRYV